MLVDGNLLLYAVDEASPHHRAASDWLTAALNGHQRVGLPWLSLGAFLRITTSARATHSPLSAAEAWSYVREWLACDLAWIPSPTDRHADVLGSLIERYDLGANLIRDARLAALAVEHGLDLYSVDTDFARFSEIRWVNPLS